MDVVMEILGEAFTCGYKVYTNDGNGVLVEQKSFLDTMAAIKSVEEVVVNIDTPDKGTEWMLVIYGLAPDERVADFTCGGFIEEIWDAYTDRIEYGQ